MEVASFEELAAKRRRWIESSRENGFENGIRRLLTDLYPDKAHFLYELLQNAEDAKATKVEFRLESAALIFVHDGKRLFDLKDVESITNIGDSTKRDDGGSIGKFGIGFKAVFAYTSTPIVHSGDWHFKICNTVVPEKTDEDVNNRFAREGNTLFKFPFDNPQKPMAKAYQEIKEGLSSLAPETILFLKNIREIYISFGAHESLVTKVENGNMTVLQRLGDPGESAEVRYLKFGKTIEAFALEDGTNPGPLTIGIAYRLQLKEGLREPSSGRPSESYEIVPITSRNVFVFFPAEKETSGLRFCIHAPFASTAARDSVRDTNDNRRIVTQLIDLQMESLRHLKAEGFLTTEFLGILPNSKDNVPDMYSGFRELSIQLFKEEPLTPTRSGGYAPATDLFKGSRDLCEVISDEDLAELQGEGSKWVKNAKQTNSTADNFLSDLEIPKYDIEQLVGDFETADASVVHQIMSRKTNDQLASLYSLLLSKHSYFCNYFCNYVENQRFLNRLRRIPIIRLSTGDMECADAGIFTGDPLWSAGRDQNCKFVDHEIYGGKKRDEILRFLRSLGIEECNEISLMKSFINRFWKNEEKRSLSEEASLTWLPRLVKLVEEKKIDADIAKRFPVRNQRGQYVEISRTYVDEPYAKTGLSCLIDVLYSEGFHLLGSLYADHLSKEVMEKFRSEFNNLGVRTRLWLKKKESIEDNPYRQFLKGGRFVSTHKTEQDYDIPGLARIIADKNEPQSRLVWELLLSVRPEELKATYRASLKDPGREAPAKYICTLTDSAWIPCKDGIRRKPCDACFEDLPDGWTRPSGGYDYPSLVKIQFGQATKSRREKQEQVDEMFRRYGFQGGAAEANEVAALLREMKARNMTIEQSREKLFGQKKAEAVPAKELPKKAAGDVSKRMAKAKQNYGLAHKQEHITVERSVHTPGIRDDARTYLREEYERDGEMFCQLCRHQPPFLSRDGYGYFVATQVFTRMHKDIIEQFLALCPQCYAKYDEWIRRSDARVKALKTSILAHSPTQGEESVRIPLPGDPENDVKSPLSGKTLYFTGTHFIDLRQAVLEDDAQGMPED